MMGHLSFAFANREDEFRTAWVFLEGQGAT